MPAKAKTTVTKKTLKKTVNTIINSRAENKEKYYNMSSVGGTFSTGIIPSNFQSISYGSSTCIGAFFSGVARGDSPAERVGNKLTAKSLYMTCQLKVSEGINEEEYNNIRLMVVQPKKQVDSTNPLLFTQQLLSGAASSTEQLYGLIDTNAFNIFYDKLFHLRNSPLNGSTDATVPGIKNLQLHLKLNRQISWTLGNDTPITDIFLVALSDSTLSPHPSMIGNIKVNFIDI